ncbi:hypothetical protein HW555_009660 [Spodoptera exigua]|uniref:Uncharacterized protein n=1 Tax=Spodoptera exigua TaxID=7107 RepID=A0A835GAM6_SPOEX|nr:hypothetical protein HW555_009660 [Spodoptera exigua]
MNIQPCGNVTAVAYYIAKYASKYEPNDCGDVFREAVQKATRHSNDVWKQLFALSMAILGQRLSDAKKKKKLSQRSKGCHQKIKWPALRRDQFEAGELPEAVLNKFDDETVRTRVKDAEGLVAIAPTYATFQANKGYGDVKRLMLPLILSWAATVQ